IEGLMPTPKHPFANTLNYQIAKTLNAEIVFVLAPGNRSNDQLKQQIEIACSSFGDKKNKNITGVIINKLNAPV
ncbi:MAG: AAA family ATPase, partial [Candidatus Regiella insecticola]|nr:AAA family ATPase [Candidatus Regiella insecticola]